MQSTRIIRFVITGLVLTASIAGFFLLRDSVGPNAAVITVLPVAVIAAYFGTRWGLLATSIAFPANVFLLDRSSGDLVSPFVSVSLLLVAWIFGQLHRLETTAQAESEARLKELQGLEQAVQRTRELLDAFPDTVMRITSSGRIVELHGQAHLGLTDGREDTLYRPVAEVVSPGWQEELLELARAAAGRDTTVTARQRVEIGGEPRIIETRVAALPGGDAVVAARVVEGATIGPL